jgi:hypothetical protein
MKELLEEEDMAAAASAAVSQKKKKQTKKAGKERRRQVAEAKEAGEDSKSVCVCGAPQPKLKCSRCASVCYCSKQCQKGDWKVHKLECKETPSKGICDKEVRQVQLDARPGADLRSADVEDEVLGAESAVGGAAAWQGDEHDQTSEAGHAAVAPDLSAALDLSSKKQDLCLTARAREGNSDGVPTKKKRRKPKKKTGADDDDVSVQQEDAAEIAKARQQKLDLEEKAAWAFQEETRKSVLAERTFECNIEYLVRQ